MDEQARRVALVTGGDGRVGKATALKLAELGWAIFLQTSSEQVDAEQALDDVVAAGEDTGLETQVVAARADLTNHEHREQLIEQTLDTFGQIDLLVSAAWDSPAEACDLLEITEPAFCEVMESTATATLFLTQLVANEMVRQVQAGLIENPRIVTINSLGAYTSSTGHGPQCISRAALAMMTQLFADRLGEFGINVYEIRVGMLSAGTDDPVHAQYDTLIEEGLTPIRRWGHPDDVAGAVAAVAENLLAFSTGEVINVDGGFHLRRL